MDAHVLNGDISIQIAQEPMSLLVYAMANLVLMFRQLRFAIKEFFNLKLNLRNKNKERDRFNFDHAPCLSERVGS